jgi:hypothetical protein
VVFLLSIPVAIIRPDLAKFLWLLVFVSGLALRGLEPADEESATIDELGGCAQRPSLIRRRRSTPLPPWPHYSYIPTRGAPEPTTFRLRVGCFASIWTAPDGSSLLTWDASSV